MRSRWRTSNGHAERAEFARRPYPERASVSSDRRRLVSRDDITSDERGVTVWRGPGYTCYLRTRLWGRITGEVEPRSGLTTTTADLDIVKRRDLTRLRLRPTSLVIMDHDHSEVVTCD